MNANKKQSFNAKNTLTASVLILALTFVYFSKPKVTAQSADDLVAQKQAIQQKLDDINNRISGYQKQIASQQKQANTLKNQIAVLNLEIVSVTAQIEQTQDKISAANLEIADVTNQIVQTEANIEKEKNILRDLIAQINDLDQRSPLEIALENDNFTDFLNDMQFTTSIQERSQEALNQIKQFKADLEARQLELKKQKNDLDTLNQQLTLQQSDLQKQNASKQQLLDKTRGQEKAYQQLLSASEADQKALNDEINNLDNQIAAKLGNRRLPGIKGLFAWPMDGTLTQGYGNTGFTSLGYSFHNGIDIAAPAGTPIYAAADGVVKDTGTGEGAYGNWVTVQHPPLPKYNNKALVTLYGHMSHFVVIQGQTLKQGDLIGFEGNTGNTTRLLYGPHRGYHLHFTVFDADGYGVQAGTLTKKFGPYMVPYGATYNPLDYL